MTADIAGIKKALAAEIGPNYKTLHEMASALLDHIEKLEAENVGAREYIANELTRLAAETATARLETKRVTAQRDAALARVAALENCTRIRPNKATLKGITESAEAMLACGSKSDRVEAVGIKILVAMATALAAISRTEAEKEEKL